MPIPLVTTVELSWNARSCINLNTNTNIVWNYGVYLNAQRCSAPALQARLGDLC